MLLSVKDLDDQTKYNQILAISYDDLLPFILDHLGKKYIDGKMLIKKWLTFMKKFDGSSNI
jgi:hypothetical protein